MSGVRGGRSREHRFLSLYTRIPSAPRLSGLWDLAQATSVTPSPSTDTHPGPLLSAFHTAAREGSVQIHSGAQTSQWSHLPEHKPNHLDMCKGPYRQPTLHFSLISPSLCFRLQGPHAVSGTLPVHLCQPVPAPRGRAGAFALPVLPLVSEILF